ncbi:thiamine pyrophosphate protein TPP binding domain protein [Desulfatibacillum aliphaticivorans]|uniref:Thiamine pyrophosphate protein TPP binding domain protein n=1 Tax=Desulfatibacillum aliphaticivorans TaxID=218208 RepID=B8FMX7_DESAL|nr:thiamine pyrophosphate-binding protein [Desulfatibacillum aliphaticivorans]ACL05847.1 thiamine pyrophosphate protein TPP binding domain protein [Desulfatibacillum aliphaticivorans]
MSQITGGHLVAKYLKEIEGVEAVFTLSGAHIENILDGLNEFDIRSVDVRHEQAASMMAHAWSLYTEKPGVCLVTAGPGFTNALTGIANAFLDNAPMVVLCGRHPLRDDLKGALQEMNQIDMVKSVVKWSATCHDIKRIPEYLSIAFRQAVEGRPGPVFLELPPDILSIAVDLKSVDIPKRRTLKTSVTPDKEDLKAAAKLIDQAKKPLLIGGSGVGFSKCGKQVAAFAEKTGIPFALLNNGRGALPDSHPRSINEGGFTAVMAALPQVDLVIIVGLRLNWVMESGQTFPDAKVVRIDIDPAEIDRNRTSDVGLAGDAGQILDLLTPMVASKDRSQWEKDLRTAYGAFLVTEREQREQPSYPIHPNRLVAQIQKVVGEDAYYVVDGGDTSYYGSAGFSSIHKAGVTAPASSLLGCIGTGVPFALAAKIAHPNKPVILLNGDGSFGFNGMEFDTAVRLNIPIVCVVNNDCAWGMIKHAQEMSIGPERCTCSELGTRHYEKMVEALGGYGEFVEKDEDIVPALKRAIESGKPACVNVMTDCTAVSPATVVFYQTLSDF